MNWTTEYILVRLDEMAEVISNKDHVSVLAAAADKIEELSHKKRIKELEDAIQVAITIIGHAHDDGTKYLKSVLEKS